MPSRSLLRCVQILRALWMRPIMMMLHSFFQHLPSLAGVLLVLLVLLVVLMLEEEVRFGVVTVVVCHGLGEVVVRPSLELGVAFGGVGVPRKGSGAR